MQLPGAVLATLLCTAVLCSRVFSAPYGADTPTACCFSYTSRQIPSKFVADYFETSSQCSKPGVIFLTKRNRQICANPSEAWVEEYITHLELNASVTRKLQGTQ
ncbi:C-C motif chemokine 3-like 1 [Choloepus didactylus]|uniref:C-C motif chemokine 3-like 1 n=1 Tax=Choloepus didactylus TaxID=27675 RepID=UPI00189D51E0|nr:C-C motif chemokine 3-like 1 [Choloepus didactylus]